MPSSEPFPHGQIFGVEDGASWFGQFAFRHDKWFFSFVDENDEPTEIYGVGDTPLEAFERLVFAWTFRNGGVESSVLRHHMTELREHFNSDGSMNPMKFGNLSGEMLIR